MNFESLSVLQDETGDANAVGRCDVPLDDPPAHGVVLGELDGVDEVDGVDFATDEGVEAGRVGRERRLDLLVVTLLKFPPSAAARLVEPMRLVGAAAVRGGCHRRGEVGRRPLQELRAAEESRRDRGAAEAAAAGAVDEVGDGETLGIVHIVRGAPLGSKRPNEGNICNTHVIKKSSFPFPSSTTLLGPAEPC